MSERLCPLTAKARLRDRCGGIATQEVDREERSRPRARRHCAGGSPGDAVKPPAGADAAWPPPRETQSSAARARTQRVAALVIDHRTEQPISGVLVYVETPPMVATTD